MEAEAYLRGYESGLAELVDRGIAELYDYLKEFTP